MCMTAASTEREIIRVIICDQHKAMVSCPVHLRQCVSLSRLFVKQLLRIRLEHLKDSETKESVMIFHHSDQMGAIKWQIFRASENAFAS